MNFYIAEPVTRLPLFNFLVRYIFTEVLIHLTVQILMIRMMIIIIWWLGLVIP